MSSSERSLRLPILQRKTAIRPSRMTPRRVAVLLAVHLAVAAHITHWWLTGSTLSPLEPSEAMEFSKHDVVNAGLVLFASAALVTALVGRFFCGWGCHLVALQDLSRSLLIRLGIRPRKLGSRALAVVPLLAFLYMFIWPWVYRLAAGHRIGPVSTAFVTESFWKTFPGWAVALLTFAVCGFLAVYLLGSKGFCTYACPYGAIFGLADRLAPVRIRVTDACEGCGHCTATCTSNVRVHEEVRTWGMVIDPGCMKCMDCVTVCPNDALYLGAGRPAVLARERTAPRERKPSLSWGEEILALAAFGLAFFAFRGLYGIFPFLMSLGWAACVAYLVLLLDRLRRRDHLSLRRFTLKRDGKLLAPGRVLLGVGLLMLVAWIHAAGVQLTTYRAASLYERTAELRAAFEAGAPALSVADAGLVERTRAAFDRAASWSVLVDPAVELQRAWLERLAGDDVAFRRRAESALARAPGNTALRLELAHHLVTTGELGAAAGLYEQVLDLDAGLPGAALNLGLIRAREGRFAAAAAAFDRGIRALPGDPALRFNRALVHLAEGAAGPAIRELEVAVELDPDYREARENLAGLLAATGQLEEAIGHFERALVQAPDDAATWLLLARAQMEAGDVEASRAALGRAEALGAPPADIAAVRTALGAARSR